MSRPLQSPPPLDLEAVLNPEQVAAVTHRDGHQLVLAGAGSGRTRVITYRIAWLVQETGAAPERIAAVTFTNKAAAEMRERVEDLLGVFPLPTFVGTFHRFALLLLRRYGERLGLKRDFAILDTTDQLGLVKSAIEAEGLSDKSYTPRSMLSAISGAKNRLLTPDSFEAGAHGFFERKVAAVFRRYQGLLHGVSGVDFDDMIALAVRLLTREEEVGERVRGRLDHLLVDEYQDTNHAQLELIRGLVGDSGRLTAVGDEDQSIYRWRGAEIDNILTFEKSFPGATVRKLERNYRSTQTILDAAGALVARNERRRGKHLWTDAGAGEPIEVYKADDEVDEARWIVNALQGLRGRRRLSEMAILVRTNAQTRALEDELSRQEVPYVLVGGTRFYDRAEIKDLIAYLKVIRNPRDAFSFARILNQPPRGIGKATEEMLRQEAAERGLTPWDLIAQDELGNLPARSAGALRGFGDLVKELRQASEELPLPALLDLLLERTGYLALYQDKRDAESEARLENVRELLSAAQEFTEVVAARPGDFETDDLLTAFLDHVSLVADIDAWQGGQGVSVMTLHSAKGLEFHVVVTAGLEQGLLPHYNSQGTPDDVEEERRLLYVGMTRAKEKLVLTCCRRRRIAGRYQDQMESPFLRELPETLTTVTQSPSLFHREPLVPAGRDRLTGVYSFFGRDQSTPTYGAPTPGAAERGIRKGSRVEHPVLGAGVVLATEGSGDQEKITVFFQKAGKKKLVAKYANLELV